MPIFAIAIPMHRSLHTPEPRNPQKSQKAVPGPPVPECQKNVERVPESWLCSLFDSFFGFLGLVRHFFDTPGRDSENRDSENGPIQGPLNSDTP